MQNHKIYKQFTVGLACGLMMLITTTVTAGRPLSQYSLRVIGEQNNPWVLPQAHNSATGFQHMPKSWGQQNQGRQIEQHDRGFRFVTPEILASLKQQQIQSQLMTENKPRPLMPRQSIQNYASPSSGMGFTNPLYDTPAVSPWSSGSDILYGGESSPFVPEEAIAGLSPFHNP